VVGHEAARAGDRAFLSQTSDLAVVVNLVVLKNSELLLLVLMLVLLGGGVDLLLSLLTTTSKSEHKVKSGLLLDVVVRESSTILKLFTSED